MLLQITQEHHRRFVHFMAAAVMFAGFLAFVLYHRNLSLRCAPYVRFLPATRIGPDSPLSTTTTSGASGAGSDLLRLNAVKDAFLYNYRGYIHYAWACDSLAPVSKKGIFQTPELGGFGAPILDSLSTMVIMDLHTDVGLTVNQSRADDAALHDLGADSHNTAIDAALHDLRANTAHGHAPPSSSASPAELFHSALNYTRHLELTRSKSPDGVSLFELTIRYIGGLLSTFELLGSPASMRFLVDQAETLARSLSGAFVNEIPYNAFRLAGGDSAPESDETTTIAAAGSLVLEWGKLSDLTGNATYRTLAEGAEKALMQADKVFPGMPANEINPNTGQPSGDKSATFGPPSDSYYEYLFKYPFWQGDAANEEYLANFKAAYESARQNLVIKTGPLNLTFLSELLNGQMTYRQSQLTCYIGSVWTMGGRALNMPDMTTLGLEVAESCAQTFIGSPSGIGPAAWNYRDAQGSWSGSNTLMRRFDDDFYGANGFNIEVPVYVHGPEVFEAVFTAWRVTGDELWRDVQWAMFSALRKHLDTAAGESSSASSPQGAAARAGAGWAMLYSIDAPSWYSARPPWDDRQASFLYSQVFKYFYLTFASPAYYSLDEWVFSTEAHPLRLQGSPAHRTQFGKIQFDAQGAQPFAYRPLLAANRANSRLTSVAVRPDAGEGEGDPIAKAKAKAKAKQRDGHLSPPPPPSHGTTRLVHTRVRVSE